jgi:hypothetical protein
MKIMNSAVWFLCVLAPFLLASCEEPEGSSGDLVWVAKMYSGGFQCDPLSRYVAPDVRQVLGEAGIPVFDVIIEHYGVCAACGCPTYAAMHYALVHRFRLARAELLGFAQKEPSEELQSRSIPVTSEQATSL